MADSVQKTINLQIPLKSFILNEAINAITLPIGNNAVHFQFKDSIQFWSSVLTDTFYRDPVPQASFTISDSSICINDTIAFTNQSIEADTFKWFFGDGDSSSAINPKHLYDSSAVFSITLIATNTLSGYADTLKMNSILTVHSNPIVTISPGSATMCVGHSVQLIANGGSVYNWTPLSGLNTYSGGTVIASPLSTTTYTVTGTSTQGCSAVDSTTILVNSLPVVSITADTGICIGENIQLNASGGSSYFWAPSTGLNYNNIPNPLASPVQTIVYTVSVTDSNSCVGSDSVSITVNTLPNANAGPDVTICQGTSTQLSASGGITFTWSPASGLNTTTGQQVIASPMITTTYTVTVTDSNGCVNIDSVIVFVDPELVVSVSPSNPGICIGQSIQLTANGASSYTWTPATGLNTTIGQIVIANPLITTTYTVMGTSGTCSGDTNVTVVIHPNPIANAGPDITICEGTSTQLNATGGIQYLWTPVIGLSNPNIANPVASPQVTTTYTVNVIDGFGCSSDDVIKITVLPAPTVSISPIAAICSGSSTQLQAFGGIAYLWTPSTGLNNPSIPNPIASPPFTTIYTVSVTGSNQCIGTDSLEVIVNPLPIVDAGADITICQGTSTTLTASGGSVYHWAPGTGLNTNTGQQVVASPTTTIPYTVTAIDSNGCVNIDSVTVFVDPVLVLSVTPNNPDICIGQSVLLTASGASTYTWSPVNSLDTTSGQTVVANPTNTTIYTINGYSGSCTGTTTFTVQVNPNPIANAGIDDTICSGTSIQLSASGGIQYSWNPISGLSNPNIANPLAKPSTSTTYTVTVTNSYGCSSIDSVNVILLPSPVVSVSPDADICLGSSVSLQASGGISYLWSPANGLNQTNLQNPIASPMTSTTYSVQVTGSNQCIGVDSVKVTVHPLPNADAGTDITICHGTSTQLIASGGIIYKWAPPTGLNTTTGQQVIASPTGTTVYTVTVTSLAGCIDTDTVKVTVSSNLNITTIPVNPVICLGDTIPVTAFGGFQYTWMPNYGINTNTGNSVLLYPKITTTYTIVVTAGACVDTSAITVDVLPNPTANAGADVEICDGNTTTLHGVGGSKFQWKPNIAINDTNLQSPTVFPSATLVYSLTVIDSNNCQSSDDVMVTVFPNPLANAGNDTAICIGSSLVLNGSGGQIFKWVPFIFLNNPSLPNPTASPTINLTYTLIVTDSNNCSSEDSISIVVNPIPIVNAGSDQLICFGDTIQLNASGGMNYQWYPIKGLNNAFISNPKASPDSSIIYTVTIIDSNQCTNSDSLKITVNPSPQTPVISQLGMDLISSSPFGNQWYDSIGPIAGAIYQKYTPLTTGTYYVEVTDSSGCSTISLPFAYIFTGFFQLHDELTVKIYPNPTMDFINIEFDIDKPSDYKIIVENLLGVRMIETHWEKSLSGNNTTQLDFRGFPGGYYNLSLLINQIKYHYKIIMLH
jgi:Secretion system C-terminal sorting domain/PKD domain